MVLNKLVAGALSLGLAASSCGDTINYYNGEVPQETYDNPCGNSPIYGKFLWEISGCKWSIHAKEDCTIDVSSKDFQEDYENDYEQRGTYDGLDLFGNEGEHVWLDPEARAVPGPYQRDFWQKLNQVLDKYNGYILLPGENGVEIIDDNAFIPAPGNRPFPGKRECKATPYYVGRRY